MDCFFHNNVPSVAQCTDCRKPICATCRDGAGACPGCRLAAKLDAAAATRGELPGAVPPHREAYREQRYQQQYQQQPEYQQPAARASATVATLEDPVESRALVALGYPIWPLAALSLFDRKQSRFLKRQAIQALSFNFGMAALGTLLFYVGQIPVLGWSAWMLSAFVLPVWLVGVIFYGIKTFNGDEVRIPIISDWVDEKIPTA